MGLMVRWSHPWAQLATLRALGHHFRSSSGSRAELALGQRTEEGSLSLRRCTARQHSLAWEWRRGLQRGATRRWRSPSRLPRSSLLDKTAGQERGLSLDYGSSDRSGSSMEFEDCAPDLSERLQRLGTYDGRCVRCNRSPRQQTRVRTPRTLEMSGCHSGLRRWQASAVHEPVPAVTYFLSLTPPHRRSVQ